MVEGIEPSIIRTKKEMVTMNFRRKVGAAMLAACVLSAGSAYAGQVAEKWMTGDIHQHSYFTDGSYPINT